jgi:hypothetical protein
VPITATVVETLALQVVIAVLTLGFGVQALRVAPAPGASVRTAAWFMAGITFTFEGVLVLIHSTAAVVAVALGSHSRFWDVYMKLVPVGNDARSLLVLGFAVGLAWVLLLGRPAPPARAVVVAACLFALAGAAAGFAEPPLQQHHSETHLGLMSVLNAATALLLFGALYRGMVREKVDWLLWTALALYAAQEALSSNIQTMIALAGVQGGWAPPARAMLWAGLVATCVMVACSVRRLAIARAGGDPPGLLERLRG